MTATSTAENELDLLRRVHAGATRRAAVLWKLVTELKDCVLWLPREAACERASSFIFFNQSYDASQCYATEADFRASLTEDLDAAWPDRETRAGVDGYCIKPFFAAKTDYLHQLDIGYLRVCDLESLQALAVDLYVAPPTTAVTGVSESELEALKAFHRKAALRIVNAMRHLATALNYLRSDLAHDFKGRHNKLATEADPRIRELVDALTAGAALPFEPAPCQFFGTDADRINRLRNLPADTDLLEPLLSA